MTKRKKKNTTKNTQTIVSYFCTVKYVAEVEENMFFEEISFLTMHILVVNM